MCRSTIESAFLTVCFVLCFLGGFAEDIRVFVLPGADLYGDYPGWSVNGGFSIENRSGIPWSVGLWYGYSSIMHDSFTSFSHNEGLIAGIPFSWNDSIPISFVPLLSVGAREAFLQSTGNPEFPVIGGVLEPGLEIRFGFFRPLELSAYAGYRLIFYPSYTDRYLHAGISLGWLIPDVFSGKPAMLAEKVKFPISSNASTNPADGSIAGAEDTNSISMEHPDFKKDVQTVLATEQSNRSTNLTEATNASAPTNDSLPVLETGKTELVIRFSEVLFGSGSASPSKETVEILHHLGNTFKKYPKLLILVEGHTDNQGNPVTNQELSEKRAKAVSEELYKSGVPRRQVLFQGFGDTDPAVPNDTEENRQKNRRVNIRLLFPDAQK